MKIEDIINELRGARGDFDRYDDEGLVDVWQSWYKGKTDFHSYTVFNGKKKIACKRKSLQMAKRVCEDWAALLLNEKTDVSISDAKTAENVNSIFEDTRFWEKGNAGIEKSFALGYGALVWTVDVGVNEDGTSSNTGSVGLSFFNRKKMIPVTVENGEIVECAFFQTAKKQTRISLHRKNEAGLYEVINATADGENIDSLSYDPASVYIFETRSEFPLFAILEPNVQNNIDIDSPYGISIFANAIDVLEGVDIAYDSEVNEFVLGRKRIFTNATKLYTDTRTGETIEVFDSNDVVIYQLPEDMDGSTLIKDDTQSLRIADHESGIQANLNRLSAAVGFGNNRYRYDNGSVATATQVISENSDMFRNIKKHEITLGGTLVRFIRALMRICNEFTPYKMDESANIEIKFDDSIIEDKGAEIQRDLLYVSNGIISKAEFRSKHLNEDLETAQRAIDEISAFTIDDSDAV